ncbi:MAG: phytanoyl-CoA dioxygenase family protein, partial [bacterium]
MTTGITRFTGETTPQLLVDAVRETGAAIVEGLLDADSLARLEDEIMPWVEATAPGQDDFSGRRTTRTGALVARSPSVRDRVMDPLVTDAARTFLGPFCAKIQLHLTQLIRILPGQASQLLHRDRLAWGGFLPAALEPQFNTIWAVTDFTSENGATQVVPGSPA